MVRIYPESGYRLPDLEYCFYGEDNVLVYRGVGAGGRFEGGLPIGVYRTIAVNALPADVKYEGMERMETATARATNLMIATRMGGPTPERPLSRAGQEEAFIYRVVDEFRIPEDTFEDDTLTLTPASDPLTHRLELVFTMDAGLQDRVATLSGALCGVYPSVNLYTGETSLEEIRRSPGLQLGYTAVPTAVPGRWTASLPVFGLYTPDYGTNYFNVMTVTVKWSDGSAEQVPVDLTEELSKALAHYTDGLPVDVPLVLEIELSLHDITIEGKALPWKEYTGREIEI
jgi:hypothetical protein